jgi:hypothetical protein
MEAVPKEWRAGLIFQGAIYYKAKLRVVLV